MHSASLPTVSSGVRPGPPLLYESPPKVPELSVHVPFRSQPLLVSGTDAYRRGEYVYQDYLFDDHGADTDPLPEIGISPAAGDVLYPTGKDYAGNAADLVEFRVLPTRDSLVYRITLNTTIRSDAAAVGIGIDRDRRGDAAVPWPKNAGVLSPGLDAFITAWGTGGEVAVRPKDGTKLSRIVRLPSGAVEMSVVTNQMTIRVPRALPGMDPGRSTWRYVAGVGLWDNHEFTQVLSGGQPSRTQPAASGDRFESVPAIFNLAFRFDEPRGVPGLPAYGSALGYGSWFEEDQARTLADNSSGRFFVDVDFAALYLKTDRWLHTPGVDQARIHASGLRIPEGIQDAYPSYGGRLQPYMLHLPRRSPGLPGITFALHGNTATYTQYAVYSPRYLLQIGDQRNSIVVTPLGRSTSGWGTQREFFEVWADVAHRFRFDPYRVALSGYSAGAVGTFRLAVRYPDLFGRAWPIVGAARGLDTSTSAVMDGTTVSGGSSNDAPMLGNVRWIPFMAWNQVVDELAPYAGIRLAQARFDELGLRGQTWSFPVGEHFTLALSDHWEAAIGFLGESRVKRDPSRVDYAITPITWIPDEGLVADHAYWVSGVRLRDHSVRDDTSTARGYVAAKSRAFGEGDPIPTKIVSAHTGRPYPATIDGTGWKGLRSEPRSNAIDVDIRNLSGVTIDGRRARLTGERPLTVKITSDGGARIRLVLPFFAETRAREKGRSVPANSVTVGRSGAVFTVTTGVRTFVISR